MGAVAAVALPQLRQAEPKVCRRGHILTPDNTRRTARGVQCLTCRSERGVSAGRTCESCGVTFFRKGPNGALLCARCKEKPRLTVVRPTQTRVCVRCDVRQDLDEFLTANAGMEQYVTTCEECRTENSPFALARAQVEKIFGRPSSEWMNRGRHPLNVLHHARMVSINNSRPGNPTIPVRSTWDLMTAWRLIKRAGLTGRRRTPNNNLSSSEKIS